MARFASKSRSARPRRPLGVTQLGNLSCHGVVERQTTGARNAHDGGRDHRLAQRPDGEARLGRHRVARDFVGDPCMCDDDCPVSHDPDRCAGHGVSEGVLAEEAGQVNLTHCSTLCEAAVHTGDPRGVRRNLRSVCFGRATMARDGDQEHYGDRPPFRPARAEPLLTRALPLSADLPRYRVPSARRDLVAGVTVATLGIPSAMAYGELAGLSPVNGFYALLVPSLAYVLLGSSRVLVVGPEGSVSTVVAAAVLPLAVAGSANAVELASMLALLVGACFLLARLLRLGWLADYFSRPVLIGYIHGVAVVLVIGQIGKLLGLSISARDPLDRLAENARELGAVSGATVAVGAVALAVLLTFRFFVPRVPGALVVVVGAIGVSWALDLAGHGVAVVGLIPSGLPRPTLPRPGLGDVAQLAPAALGVFLVSFADEILTARSFAGRRHEPVRASQELLAMGAANVAAGFTQAFSIGAAGSRTAVNDSLGRADTDLWSVRGRDDRLHPALPDRAGAVPADARCWARSSSPRASASSTAPPGARSPRSTGSRSRSPA